VTLNTGPHNWGNGGEFQGNLSDGLSNVVADNGTFDLYAGVATPSLAGYDFVTFCAQTGQYFEPGHTYTITRIDTYTDHGSDVDLTPQAAVLFHLWNGGGLAGYDYSSSDDAGALQAALWHFQGGTVPVLSGAMLTDYTNWVGYANTAVSTWWGNTIGNVRIMQLNTANQDQFCELYDDGHKQPPLTPEPATVGMLLLGCCTLPLPLLRRRRR